MEPNETNVHTESEQSFSEVNTGEPRTESNTEAGTEVGTTIDHNTIMGILCYLGPLVLVPYFTDRDTLFVKYHIKQGLVLLAVGFILYLISVAMGMMFFTFFFLRPILVFLNLSILILAIVGIVNVIKGRQVPLPVLGSFAKNINI